MAEARLQAISGPVLHARALGPFAVGTRCALGPLGTLRTRTTVGPRPALAAPVG